METGATHSLSISNHTYQNLGYAGEDALNDTNSPSAVMSHGNPSSPSDYVSASIKGGTISNLVSC